MEIRVEGRRVEDESVTLTVRVAASELESLERGACLVVAQRNNIDLGGNETARQLLESALGVSEAASLVTQTMKNFVAPFALSSESEDYSVVGAPIFDADRRLEAEGDLVFDATWTRLGAVTLSSYEPLELAVPPVSVSEAEIDARMEEVAQTYTGVEPDESRTQVAEGDVVQISMDCLKDGERFEQLCFANRLYRAGSGQMPDGFDEALAHAPVGSMVHVDFLLPTREELDGTLSGPSVCAEVKVEAIMREVACVLNDDFISQSIPGASSVVELRELSRKELERQKAEQMRHYRKLPRGARACQAHRGLPSRCGLRCRGRPDDGFAVRAGPRPAYDGRRASERARLERGGVPHDGAYAGTRPAAPGGCARRVGQVSRP